MLPRFPETHAWASSVLRSSFFDKHDPVPGPTNPGVFADDLHVELYDPDSGNRWWQSYFIATPDGLADVLHNRAWGFLYAPQVLVFPQYDLEEIRRAVVSRIKADHNFCADNQDPVDEAL